MRGNHRVWGRVVEPIADRISVADRRRIEECELREFEDRRYYREVWLRERKLGLVRVRADGQWFKPVRGRTWRFAGATWGDNDPKWGLAILELLSLCGCKNLLGEEKS